MTHSTEYDPIDLAREQEFSLGAIRVKPASREVIFDDQAEVFEPRVLQVLVALAQRRGAVVSRDELNACCWEGRAVGDDALNRCIARLRRLAEASGEFVIETIPRVGYRLAAAKEASPVIQSLPTEAIQRSFLKRHARALSSALLVTVGVAVAIGLFFKRESRVVEASLEERTVIVLPFAALDDDADLQHLAQGISASITHALSQSGVRVVSPVQAERFRSVGRARASEETGARFIFDGEVIREDKVIRVIVRSDDGRTGRTLWSEVFESEPAAAVGLTDIITGYVGGRSWAFTQRRIPSDYPEVNDAYFRTIELMMRGETRGCYDVAVGLARKYPDDLLAQSMLAKYSTVNYWLLPQGEVEPVMRAARVAAMRVADGAPYFGDNYIVLSNLVPPQRWVQREEYLRKGLKVDPETAGVSMNGRLAEFLETVGRVRDAEALARGEAAREPFNITKVIPYYLLLRKRGDQNAATKVFETGNRYWPGHPYFEVQRFASSDFRGAAPEAANMMLDSKLAELIEPASGAASIRQMLHALASRQPADIDPAVKGCSRGWVSYHTTQVCLFGLSQLGRMDDLFLLASTLYPELRATPQQVDEHWLRRDLPFFGATELFRIELAPMRADARFIALVERIGLLDYWRVGHSPDFCESERAPVCDLLHQRPVS